MHRKAEKCWNLINEESSKNINFPQTKVNLEKIKKLIAKKTLNEDKKLKDTFKKAKLKIVNNQNKNIDLLNFDSNDSTNCEMIFEKGLKKNLLYYCIIYLLLYLLFNLDKNDQNKHLKQSQVQIEVIVNDKYAGNFEINAHGKECIG